MHANLSLFPRSRSSVDVNDIERFAAWLSQHGYRHEQTCNSQTEYARLRGVYNSGAVVLGGPVAGVSATLVVLSPLILSDDVAPMAIQAKLF